uniref:Uncharacterized protein n=1 Tax=Melopsittacus undulatus TaxID=13146 RepID=A0A8V5GU64_MELUD
MGSSECSLGNECGRTGGFCGEKCGVGRSEGQEFHGRASQGRDAAPWPQGWQDPAVMQVPKPHMGLKKSPSCPPCPTPSHSGCREHGIGYRQRCFYFVEDAAEWNQSESFCQTLGAHLASIRTWEELRFLVRYGGSRHHWIGLRREGAAPWMWVNGTLFNNEFQVRGRGQCAFVDGDGISSDWCSLMKFSVCSHPQAGSRSDPEGWNLT